ncbi:hypothetical protein [Aureimonas leprariae]|uniref:Uncharacterized protein n=1 Tax=Plantimonas leprariae TaxID=2615207 RepID=A0A7V7PL44_9HYPH|nr:hypothetical protein [Aureimonas leprariae]KAB0676719.1 hypothetical protein F6X38_20680 [Aureimonas leprariae]
MPEVYLADRLQRLARHECNIAQNATNQEGRLTPCAAVVLAQSLHHTLLAFIAFHLTLNGDLDSERKSLVELARTIAAEDVRTFEPWEMDKIASLDVIHMRPVTCVLLPEEMARDIFWGAQGFVDTLTREMWTTLEHAKANVV